MKHKMAAIILISIIMTSCSYKGSAIVANKPLYESKDGWKIWSAKSGDWLTKNYYERVASKLKKYNLPTEALDKTAFGKIYRSRPVRYIAFVIASNGHNSFWYNNSKIIVTYKNDGKEYIIASTRIFTIEKESLTEVIPNPYIQIPNERYFTTPKDNTVLIAEFETEIEADTLLSCDVLDVRSN